MIRHIQKQRGDSWRWIALDHPPYPSDDSPRLTRRLNGGLLMQASVLDVTISTRQRGYGFRGGVAGVPRDR